MAQFVIQPHERLQDWVAHENGYFSEEGLDYEIAGDGLHGDWTKPVDPGTGALQDVTHGAFESYEEGGGNKGERSDISCACHWAVNQAAASNIGKMWGKAYSVCPAAVVVRQDSAIDTPADLAGREIAVGHHSGSHFTTVQALEPFLSSDELVLKFGGFPWQRVDAVLDGDVAAASVWGMSYYAADQLGLRTVVDATFMMGFMFPDHVQRDDLEKYFAALRKAQLDVDLEPERYKHLYLNELPERYRDRVDVRRFGPGERIVFLPYSEEIFDKTQQWVRQRELFEEAPQYVYDKVVLSS